MAPARQADEQARGGDGGHAGGVRIASHPELINADRRALAKTLREVLADYKEPPHGEVPRGAPTWADLVNSLRPVAEPCPGHPALAARQLTIEMPSYPRAG